MRIKFFITAISLAAFLTACASIYYEGPESDHFDGVRFFLPGNENPRDFGDFWEWQRNRDQGPWPEWVDNTDADAPPERVEGSKLRVSFIGHATVFIQTQGLNILTDPTWSERASPFGFAGPKRVNAPGVDFEDLPPIDAVIISHNHYDHMDLETLKRLAAHSNPRVIVPLGNAKTIRGYNRDIQVEEYDWDEAAIINDDVTIHHEPIQHWSARGVRDRDKALWTAHVIRTPGGDIYFAGDTGYGAQYFQGTAQKFGPPRLAILPIGAYLPEWFMAWPHMSPRDALRAHADLGATFSLAHHFNTFPLADDGYNVALDEFKKQREDAGVGEDIFRALAPGQVWWVPEVEVRTAER